MASIVTIELRRECSRAIELLSARWGARIKPYFGDSADVVPQLPGFFNVAWVDGSHEQIAVLNDLWNCTGKTPLILVDDYRLTGVRKAIDEFATESDYELVASYTQ